MRGSITDSPAGSTPTRPRRRANFTVTATSFGEVLLRWADNAWNETSFVIERSIGAGGFVALATTASGVAEFLDLTAPAAASCAYRVRAINGAVSSYASATAAALTPSAPGVVFVDFKQHLSAVQRHAGRSLPNRSDRVQQRCICQPHARSHPGGHVSGIVFPEQTNFSASNP